MPLRAVQALCGKRPEFLRILGVLNDHGLMMNTLQVIGDLLIPAGERRIAAALCRIARPNPGDEGQALWPIRLSQAEIGQMSNASRDRVNRALAKFELAGWLKADFKMITIIDLTALERFAAGSGS
jgi:CRP/FNR family transcriptional regulator, cyclic AMP receptor protein